MKLRFLGHACFELQSPGHPTVLLDPYRPNGLGGRFALPEIQSNPDVIAMSHYHEDHSWIRPEWSNAAVIDGTGNALNIQFDGIPVYHDKNRGTKMGLSTALVFDYAGIRIAHLGDMGSPPDPATQSKLGAIDICLVPIGDTYTLGPNEALETVEILAPRLVIPMHGKDTRIDLPLRSASEFLALWKGPKIDVSSTGNATITELPDQSTLLFMGPNEN